MKFKKTTRILRGEREFSNTETQRGGEKRSFKKSKEVKEGGGGINEERRIKKEERLVRLRQ